MNLDTRKEIRKVLEKAVNSCFDCAEMGEAKMCEIENLFDKCDCVNQALTAIEKIVEKVQEWCDSCFGTGYNQACDDWEKYLNDLYSAIMKEMPKDIEAWEIPMTINILKLMIKHYEERGGGYSQMEALKLSIKALQNYQLCLTALKRVFGK